MDNIIFAIGHSTRTIDEFIRLLRHNSITKVVDIRTVPRSRRNPQFNIDILPDELQKAGISYEHMEGLGGFRKPMDGSSNRGWENDSFRGFADYMQTPEFEENLNTLIEESRKETIALMCAESVYWRCHRRLIADALAVRGIPVEHIMSEGNVVPHTLTSWAHVEGKKITYPVPQPVPVGAARDTIPPA